MPHPNLRRVERAGARAAAELGRARPSALIDLADRWHAADRGPAAIAELELARRAGEQLLREAVELERSALRAQEAAVEALRHVGPAPSWRDLGAILGLSAQGTHRRYQHLDGPEAQRTIDDELEGAPA